jgi:hypothetical protein
MRANKTRHMKEYHSPRKQCHVPGCSNVALHRHNFCKPCVDAWNGQRKCCSVCLIVQTVSNFYTHKKCLSLFGVNSQCKQCCTKATVAHHNTLTGYIKSMYRRTKRSAAKRGLQFGINREYLFNQYVRQDGKCHWSGIKMQYHAAYRIAPFRMSIERVDPSIGYVPGNTVLAILELNGQCQL